MHSSLGEWTSAMPAMTPGTLGSGAQAGILVDSNGWDGVLFTIHTGAVAGGATLDAYVKRDSASAFTTSTNVANAALAQITSATANSNAVFQIDVFRPAQRYLKLILTSGTAAVAVCAFAQGYKRSGRRPATLVAQQLVRADIGG